MTKKARLMRTYTHSEPFTSEKTNDILDGRVYIFPMLDGIQAQVFLSEGQIKGYLKTDNPVVYSKFTEYIYQDNFRLFFEKFPDIRIFGQWLTEKTQLRYEYKSFNKLYIIDMFDESEEKVKILDYKDYTFMGKAFEMDIVPCVADLYNPKLEDIGKLIKDKTNYLMMGKTDTGKGLIVKRYNFLNADKDTVWARVINAHPTQIGYNRGTTTLTTETGEVAEPLEVHSIRRLLTKESILDAYNEIAKTLKGGKWKRGHSWRLKNTLYHNFVKENTWKIIRWGDDPRLDFGLIKREIFSRVKKELPDLFKDE